MQLTHFQPMFNFNLILSPISLFIHLKYGKLRNVHWKKAKRHFCNEMQIKQLPKT